MICWAVFYGYNDLRWVVTIDELKRVEKELNTTDEERANELQEGFRKSFPEADSFEVMDFELIQDCNKELASSPSAMWAWTRRQLQRTGTAH